jgi:hypothetical protein
MGLQLMAMGLQLTVMGLQLMAMDHQLGRKVRRMVPEACIQVVAVEE